MNKNQVTRRHVLNYLESAGFSHSNSYYIVKQGKVNEIATAPDVHRLKILREIAGIRLYEERKENSIKILNETDIKIKKITECLDAFAERLAAIDFDKEELKEYKIFDKSRRSLEYLIYDAEIRKMEKSFEQLTAKQQQYEPILKPLLHQLEIAKQKLKLSDENLKEYDNEISQIKDDALEYEQQQLIVQKTKFELNINDLIKDVDADAKLTKSMKLQLEQINVKINEQQQQLSDILMQFELAANEENDCAVELIELKQKRKDLFTKQGRKQQFSTRHQRDKWIKNEIKSLNGQIKEKTNHQNALKLYLENDIVCKLNECKQTVDCQKIELIQLCADIDKVNEEFYENQLKHDQCQTNRNNLWRNETKLTQTLIRQKDELTQIDQIFRFRFGKSTINGWGSVQKVLTTFRQKGDNSFDKIVNGYYGTIIENFNCDPSIYRAVDVTAGNRLFYHIVIDESVCTAILNEMTAQQLPGECSFLPLNRLHVKNYRYPSDDIESVPIQSQLFYDEKLEIAFHQVFARTLLCQNLNCATVLAKEIGLDCITLDGDEVLAKGILTGGYYRHKNTRIELYHQRQSILTKIHLTENDSKTIRNDIQQCDATISTKMSKMQNCETTQLQLQNQINNVQCSIRSNTDDIERLEHNRITKENAIQQCTLDLNALTATLTRLNIELKSDLLINFSKTDQIEIDTLNEQIRCVTNEHKTFFDIRSRIEKQKIKINNLLESNLYRCRDEIAAKLLEQQLPINDRKRKLDLYRLECDKIDERLTDIASDINQINVKIEEMEKKRTSVLDMYETWQQMEKETIIKINETKSMEKNWLCKKDVITKKLKEYQQKIEELGVLPEIDPKYLNLSITQVSISILTTNKSSEKKKF